MSTKQFEIARIFRGQNSIAGKNIFTEVQALIHANLSTLRGPQYKVIQARWTLRGNSLHDENILGQEELSDELRTTGP